jgi:hypothetical protein
MSGMKPPESSWRTSAEGSALPVLRPTDQILTRRCRCALQTSCHTSLPKTGFNPVRRITLSVCSCSLLNFCRRISDACNHGCSTQILNHKPIDRRWSTSITIISTTLGCFSVAAHRIAAATAAAGASLQGISLADQLLPAMLQGHVSKEQRCMCHRHSPRMAMPRSQSVISHVFETEATMKMPCLFC